MRWVSGMRVRTVCSPPVHTGFHTRLSCAGRRLFLVYDSLIFIAGGVLCLVAGLINASPDTKYALLIVGRAVIGVGSGAATVAVPLYLNEVSERPPRHAVVTHVQMGLMGGSRRVPNQAVQSTRADRGTTAEGHAGHIESGAVEQERVITWLDLCHNPHHAHARCSS